jgi:hypothetical protein
MAKAAGKKVKSEKAVKAKEPKGSKVPKTIAGVKIPKSLRQSASSIVALIETPLGRQIIADVLIAAAGALVSNKSVTGAAGAAGAAVEKAGAEAADRTRQMASSAAQAVSDVVSEAARQILPSSMTAGESGGASETRDRGASPRSRDKATARSEAGAKPVRSSKPRAAKAKAGAPRAT